MKRHYSYGELEAFRHGEMNFLKSKLCRLHLALCGKCRAEYDHVLEDERMIDEIRSARKSMETPENPALFERLCRIFRDSPSGRNGGR